MPANAACRFLLLSFLSLLVALWVTPGQAADAAKPATEAAKSHLSTVPTEDLKSLVETLENPQSRDAFLKTARTALAVKEKAAVEKGASDGLGEALYNSLSATIGKLGTRLGHLSTLIDDVPALARDLWTRLDEPKEQRRILIALLRLFGVLAAGLAAAYVTRRLLAGAHRSMEWHDGKGGMAARVMLLLGRLFLDLLPPVAMIVIGWLTISVLQITGSLLREALVLTLTGAVLMVVTGITRTVVVPDVNARRVVPFSDETAQYVMIWVNRLGVVAFGGYLLVETAGLIGLPANSREVLLTILRILFAALLIVLVLQNRSNISDWLRTMARRGGDGQTSRRTRIGRMLLRRLADVWHVLGVLYILAFLLVWTAEIAGGFTFMARATLLSLVFIGAATLASAGIRRGLERIFAVSDDARRRFPGLERRVNRYVPMIGVTANWLIGLVAALAVLQAWGLDTIVWLTNGAGRQVTSAVITIGLVLLFALLVWETVSAWIERYLNSDDDSGTQVERSARAKTLLPLARNVIMVSLILVVSLIVLAEIGVNIAPLLAGAGVVGLAVGFGSQKLVQDVITGVFILVEDTVSVGDVAVIGGHSGVVEAMTIRSLRLRDAAGNVHTIPFSAVETITNMTKEYSYAVFEVGVGYREDTDEVTEVLREVGRDLQADPEFGVEIIEELEVLGVDQFADSAVIIKARMKTRPIKQWMVGREFNRRMKKAFDARNIEIPFPHTTVYFGVDKKGEAPPGRILLQEPLSAAPDLLPAVDEPVQPPTTDTPTTG